jgi:cytochrome bd-type quinol oxidase subunit 2
MPAEQDPLKEHLHTGVNLFPEVDLEEAIMVAVRKEAELQQKAQHLRRKGLLFLTVFLFLLALALWYTKNGYSHPIYQEQFVNYGFSLLFVLVLFAQLEAWWHKPLLG